MYINDSVDFRRRRGRNAEIRNSVTVRVEVQKRRSRRDMRPCLSSKIHQDRTNHVMKMLRSAEIAEAEVQSIRIELFLAEAMMRLTKRERSTEKRADDNGHEVTGNEEFRRRGNGREEGKSALGGH